MMGISNALFGEFQFDESGITTRNWFTNPTLKMADIPEVN